MMGTENTLFVDFVDSLLEWRLEDRLTPETAIMHPWIREGIAEIKA